MNVKKLIALLLSIILVVSCFVGCGAKEEVPAEEPETPAVEEVETPAEEEAEEPAEEEAVLGQLPLADPAEGKTLTIGLRQYATTEDYDTNAYTLWLEEQTGINLEFVLFDFDQANASTQLSLMMAGGEKLPDIVFDCIADAVSLFEYGEDGYLLDLNEYIDEYGYYIWEAIDCIQNETDKATILSNGYDPSNGALYGLPSYDGPSMNSIGSLMWINQKWLDAVGAEIPTTTDELYEVMKLFATEDPNGNGIADEIPMLGYVNGWRADVAEFLINAFVYASDTTIFNVDDDGNLWNPYDTDEYREAMKYLNKIYSEGMLSPMFYTITTGSEMQTLVTPADGVSLVGVIGAHPSLCCVADSENFKEYVALPPLKDNTGAGGYAVWRNNTFKYIYGSITADCEDPVLAFKFLDFMYSQEAMLRERYGVLGVDWEYPEEGAVDFKGEPAYFKVINPDAYGSQNNQCWHTVFSNINDANMNNEAYVSDGSWSSVTNEGFSQIWAAYKAAPVPNKVLPNLVYTVEENEVVAEYQTPVTEYIEEARAMFASGVLDPNNDADWETYVNNLTAMGIYEFMEVAQKAYTRMAG